MRALVASGVLQVSDSRVCPVLGSSRKRWRLFSDLSMIKNALGSSCMSCWMALLFISKLGPTQEWNATWFFVFVFCFLTLTMVEIISIALAFSFS